MLVVGDREKEQGTVSVRNRKHGDLGAKAVDEFLASVLDLVQRKAASE
jgi:threonyl-tRNA synthetase